MAKLNTNNAHLLAKFACTDKEDGTRLLYALRSDGKVLRRVTHAPVGPNGELLEIGGGYKIFATLRSKEPAKLREVLEQRFDYDVKTA